MNTSAFKVVFSFYYLNNNNNNNDDIYTQCGQFDKRARNKIINKINNIFSKYLYLLLIDKRKR